MFHFEDAYKGSWGAPKTVWVATAVQSVNRAGVEVLAQFCPSVTAASGKSPKLPFHADRWQGEGGVQVNWCFSEGQFQCKERVRKLQNYLGSGSPTKARW